MQITLFLLITRLGAAQPISAETIVIAYRTVTSYSMLEA